MIVDFHTHTFPERIASAAIAKMQQACHSAAFTDGTETALRQSMRESGVEHAVVLPVATNPLKLKSINDAAIHANGQQGLICFGCVHPDAPDWDEELRRIAREGLQGVKIHPVYQGVDIDDVRYVRILSLAGELGLTVVTHAGDDIGFPGVVRCSPEMTRRALRQAGPVRLVMAHMGGWRNWEEAEMLAAENVYIDTAFSLGRITPLDDGYYTPEELPLMTDDAFVRLVRLFGAHRVLFGTDSPWTDQSAELAHIRSLLLTDEEKTAILGGNAAKLLNINK